MLECKPIYSLPLSLLFLGLHHRPMIIKWCHVSCSTSWRSLTTLNPSTALASLSFDPSQLFSLAFSSYGYLKTGGLNKLEDVGGVWMTRAQIRCVSSLLETLALPCATGTRQRQKTLGKGFAECNTRQTTYGIYSADKRLFAECFLSGTRQILCRELKPMLDEKK